MASTNSVSRRVGSLVAAYLIASLVCILVPAAAVRAWIAFLWLLGPPANLIHGTRYLVPFFVGTLVVGALGWGLLRSSVSSFRRRMLTLGIAVAWAAFGVLAYAPGA
jgi:hypothetical protein